MLPGYSYPTWVLPSHGEIEEARGVRVSDCGTSGSTTGVEVRKLPEERRAPFVLREHLRPVPPARRPVPTLAPTPRVWVVP